MALSGRRWWSLQLVLAAVCGAVPLWLSSANPFLELPSLAGGADPILQCGILQWVLRHPPLSDGAWHAPFFWPSEHSLAFMDTLFGQSLLVYPLPLARSWPALAYNLILCTTLAGVFLGTVRLARSLDLSKAASLLAAFVFSLGPQAAGHFHHLNQLPSPWLPLALWGLLRVARARPDGLILVGLAVFFQPLWGVYNLAVLWIALLCALPFLLPALRHRWGLALALIYALGLLWITVTAQPYREAADALAGYVRGAETVGPYAGRPFDLLHPPSAHWLAWPRSLPGRPVLYAGILWPWLALVGWWLCLRRPKDRPALGLWLGLALAGGLSLLLAFGRSMPVPWGGEVDLPLAWFQDRFWALQSLRAPTRLFLPAALLFGLAGAAFVDRIRRLGSWPLRILLGCLCVVALFDLAPGRFPSVRAHPDAEESALIEQLVLNDSLTAWMAIPTPCDERQEQLLDARCMLWAALSGKPVAGGSSGFVPMPVRRLRRACCRGVGEVCVADLRRAGVTHLLLDTGEEPPPVGEVQWQGSRWRLWQLP